MVRDDFRSRTKSIIARRVGGLCSNPNCAKLTTGPASAEASSINIGVAAHITAASEGGPRFDRTLTAQERRHASNGIWLCQTCAHLIDVDIERYPAELLRKWKSEAEDFALLSIGTAGPGYHAFKYKVELDDSDRELLQGLALPSEDDVGSVTARLNDAARQDIEAFRGTRNWPKHPIQLTFRMEDPKNDNALGPPDVAELLGLRNEIAIVAPPGTGKTTSLLQLAEFVGADEETVAAFVPLGEWSTRHDTILGSLVHHNAFRGFREQHFMLLALHGRLLLLLDGWNELDPASRLRAINELEALRRDFPLLQIAISTRRQALNVPISGPIVELEALSEEQQKEIARASAGTAGEALLDRAWRTPGVRDLVSIPLYLSALLKIPGSAMPTTKEEILRLFIAEHEKAEGRAEVLRRELFGVHPQVLCALATEATRTANTTISEGSSRTIVTDIENRLVAEGQITVKPQPSIVLDVLVANHSLTRSGAGISFQHQQFQEWYASLEVEQIMRAASRGDEEVINKLKVDVLNMPAWEESVLFACERLSRTDNAGADAVANAIMHAIPIDPMLAAEMIYRADQRVWDRVKEKIVAFATRWHRAGRVDRAVRFMIMTGRPEFADQIWPLISHADSQIHLSALRAAPRFRPLVLGPKLQERLAPLVDEIREAIISELAMYGGIEGIDLAASLARADSSAKVQANAIGSLFFRRADRVASDILRSARDAVWSIIAEKGYVDEFAHADLLERLRSERRRTIDSEPDTVKKLGMILRSGDGLEPGPGQIEAVLKSPEFPVRDQQAGWTIATAFKRYPKEVASAFIDRLENGRELPFHGEEYLVGTPVVDSGRLPGLVLDPASPKSVVPAAVTLVGPKTISELIERVLTCHEKLLASRPHYDRSLSDEFHLLKGWVAKARTSSFIEAWLGHNETKQPGRIAVLADLFALHFRDKSRQIDGALATRACSTLEVFGERLLASPDSTRGEFAEVAMAIEQVPRPELLPILTRLLTEDLARWRRAKEEVRTARARGLHIDMSEAAHSWTLQYARALVAIDGEQVAKLMEGYLLDREFGIEATGILKGIWDRQQPPKEKAFASWHDFSEVKARRREREEGTIQPCPLSASIFATIEGLIKPGSDAEAQPHALQLARVAFSMPYRHKAELIASLLALPRPMAEKLPLLTVLVQAGEIVDANVALDGLKELLEAAKKDRWRLDENRGELESWLELLTFSNRPEATLEALELLEAQFRTPWRLRRVLEALRDAPDSQSERILAELARRDPRFFAEYEWANALLKRGTLSAVLMLIDVVREGKRLPGHAFDVWSFSEKLAPFFRADSEARLELLRQYEAEGDGPAKNLLEAVVAKLGDPAALMTIIRSYSARRKPFDGSLRFAIEGVAVGQRPAPGWANAYEEFSVEMPQLRKQLFAMLEIQSEQALASACLTTIDELRDQHGRTDAEPRHPDIDSNRPWPAEAAL
jgi:hypothetical protein